MNFKQFYLGCLSHASYYIGSENEAAVIDPQRDIQQYLDEAEASGQKIKYVVETHSHADFVSGHIELAQKTGAQIIYGQRANTEFPTLKVKDGDELALGKLKLKFLETPGHTPEGITIIVSDTEDAGEPVKVFTGDTLFIGDVGRPDLIGSKGFSAEEMAGLLYDSLHGKILPLPDSSEIYPAHGAGSLCGKSLSKETWSTLGVQRKTNYALQPMTKQEFIKIVAADQPEVPMYFPRSAAQNLKGARPLAELPEMSVSRESAVTPSGGVVIDVRPANFFGAGHIPNAVNISLTGQFASWAGTLIEIGTPIIIAADTKEQVDEARTRLARVGHDTVESYVLMPTWKGAVNVIEQVAPEEVNELAQTEKFLQFVDVRRPAEHANGHAPRTVNIPLDKLVKELDKLDPDAPTYVICQSGYRSSTATGILENAGFKKIYNVTGGTQGWINAGLDCEVSATACAAS